jgi:hypothetical protein
MNHLVVPSLTEPNSGLIQSFEVETEQGKVKLEVSREITRDVGH